MNKVFGNETMNSIAVGYNIVNAIAYSSGNAIDAYFIPSSDSINVSVTTWNTTGDYYKKWNEGSINESVTTQYFIGDLLPSSNYYVKVYWNNGTKFQDIYITSNSSGYIVYNLTGYESARYTE